MQASQQLIDEMNAALDGIRPHLEADGGDVRVVAITEGKDVQIAWSGNCESCAMSAMTLKAGIEQTLRSQYPEIRSVVAVNGLPHDA